MKSEDTISVVRELQASSVEPTEINGMSDSDCVNGDATSLVRTEPRG